MGNRTPEDPCPYTGGEKILGTTNHESWMWVRLFAAAVQILMALDFADISPDPAGSHTN